MNVATPVRGRVDGAPREAESAQASHAMDVDAAWEREYWAKHCHISEHELLRIVRRVGPDSLAVLCFIREQRR